MIGNKNEELTTIIMKNFLRLRLTHYFAINQVITSPTASAIHNDDNTFSRFLLSSILRVKYRMTSSTSTAMTIIIIQFKSIHSIQNIISSSNTSIWWCNWACCYPIEPHTRPFTSLNIIQYQPSVGSVLSKRNRISFLAQREIELHFSP